MGEKISSRRGFIMSGAAAVGGGLLWGEQSLLAADVADKLNITTAGYAYDRVQGLIDGSVAVEGCNLTFERGKIGDMNTHVFSGSQERELTEIGLLPYILAFANEDFRDYTLLPLFPLKVSRHKSIFIRTDRGINKPEDLRGKRVATPGYSSTSLTWIRGILEHEYGVKPESIHWVVSAKESSAKDSGGASKFENIWPDGLSIETGPAGKDESDLLVDGDVDALFHAAEPKAFQTGKPNIARLFADSRQVEQDYYAKTGIFPIMHAVAMRKDVIKKHAWLPQAVFNAYSQAKQQAYDYLKKSAWYGTSLPWVSQEAEATRNLMGDNYWTYGIGKNRKALNALFQYAYEQGLAKRQVTIEEVFHSLTIGFQE
ncbi:MAG: ABC transporter substrate-binding protein [Pirellulales bacterium]